jgi:hypothetical protein
MAGPGLGDREMQRRRPACGDAAVGYGQDVVDVPPRLSAGARVFSTGQGRKTDATDAHSVALVGTRMAGLRPVIADDQPWPKRAISEAPCQRAWWVRGLVDRAGPRHLLKEAVMARFHSIRAIATVLGGLALASAGVIAPASATPITSGSNHDEFSFVVEDTCGVDGFPTRVDAVADLRFRLNSRGADRLPYLNEHRTETLVFTNLATGEFVTIRNRENGNDIHATDTDGTLTYVTGHTGTSVMYNMDGKAIARDTGLSRLKELFDDAGTPTDPTDDVFLDAVPLKETGLPSIDYCAEVVQAIG